jgi:hypothetical protein
METLVQATSHREVSQYAIRYNSIDREDLHSVISSVQAYCQNKIRSTIDLIVTRFQVVHSVTLYTDFNHHVLRDQNGTRFHGTRVNVISCTKSVVFRTGNFMKLPSAQNRYVHLLYRILYKSDNKCRKDTNSFILLSKLWLSTRQLSRNSYPSIFLFSRFTQYTFTYSTSIKVGRDSSVGIATRYGLAGQGIESR